MCLCDRYLRFLTADLHGWVFWSDHKLPAPLGPILSLPELLNDTKRTQVEGTHLVHMHAHTANIFLFRGGVYLLR